MALVDHEGHEHSHIRRKEETHVWRDGLPVAAQSYWVTEEDRRARLAHSRREQGPVTSAVMEREKAEVAQERMAVGIKIAERHQLSVLRLMRKYHLDAERALSGCLVALACEIMIALDDIKRLP